MRTFSIILADDEQNILYGMQKGINWENQDSQWQEQHKMEKKYQK